MQSRGQMSSGTPWPGKSRTLAGKKSNFYEDARPKNADFWWIVDAGRPPTPREIGGMKLAIESETAAGIGRYRQTSAEKCSKILCENLKIHVKIC